MLRGGSFWAGAALFWLMLAAAILLPALPSPAQARAPAQPPGLSQSDTDADADDEEDDDEEDEDEEEDEAALLPRSHNPAFSLEIAAPISTSAA